VPKPALKAIKRALGKKKNVKAKITLRVRDTTGNTSSTTRTVTLRR